MYEKELEFARNVAEEAGKIMLKYFNADQQKVIKDDGSPVTVADIEINSLVIEMMKDEFPDDGLIGEEESTTDYGTGRKWFCDPIDGTIGFVWGTPTAAFSLGLIEDGRPVLGVAHDPFLNNTYHTVVGGPSYCNEDEIQVSNGGLDGGTVAVSSNVRRIRSGKLLHLDRLIDTKAHIASFSGAVAKSVLVAKGKFEGYIELGVGAHDMAAVDLIVENAGGKVTGLDGRPLDYTQPFRGAVVSNGVIHNELLEMVKGEAAVN